MATMGKTVKEAESMWCPMVRTLASQQEASHNRSSRCTCQSSNCMMWRWLPGEVDQTNPYRIEQLKPNRGYCGLAGKVEI